MKPEAQRIAISEACGWKQVIEELFNIQQMSWIRPGDKENHGFRPPDYLNDLNAMHEAEDVLDVLQQGEYVRQLEKVIASKFQPSNWTFEVANTTAAQRAEAFLRTLGLWKDDACPQSEVSTTANP